MEPSSNTLASSSSSSSSPPPPTPPRRMASSDTSMGFGERAIAAAGAAVVSAVIVNPLDVAKTRLQAQAAGVLYNSIWPDFRCYPSCSPTGVHGSGPTCSPDCFQYKGTIDVFYKVIRQEGFARLWRGTNASLVLAVPTVGIYLPSYDILRNWIEDFTNQHSPALTPYAPLAAGSIARTLACISCSPIELARTRMQAFKESHPGAKAPGIWKTLLGVLSPRKSANHLENSQLARDVPFSAICWLTLEPIRRRLLGLIGEEDNVAGVIGANFSAGFAAGVVAAGATCPLDKDPARILNMNTRRVLLEVWRNEGMKGLFTGVGPRVGRAGPSVGIVVSFYEALKHILHKRHANS
ncbi:Mitochondrial carrier protein MTM1 [Ananas comosus]|uniref:Mitochondrial carrier protein MTM1 n=1 Tax=Ananas comosus TaxID=4615 RepID=A0A199VV00_ANACO|nr:Mitochondrial carrier protein MTM1 [Ananas comosus]